MANLSIKDVPEPLAEALRQRAARNHRSLQGELMAIIERAADDDIAADVQPAGSPSTARRSAVRRGWKTIEQIAKEHRLRFPEPIRGGPLAVDIIREDRDSR
jgi:plasmid stability protein